MDSPSDCVDCATLKARLERARKALAEIVALAGYGNPADPTAEIDIARRALEESK